MTFTFTLKYPTLLPCFPDCHTGPPLTVLQVVPYPCPLVWGGQGWLKVSLHSAYQAVCHQSRVWVLILHLHPMKDHSSLHTCSPRSLSSKDEHLCPSRRSPFPDSSTHIYGLVLALAVLFRTITQSIHHPQRSVILLTHLQLMRERYRLLKF